MLKSVLEALVKITKVYIFFLTRTEVEILHWKMMKNEKFDFLKLKNC